MKATKVSRIAAGALSALLLSGTLFACSKEPDEASSAVSETSQSAGAIFTEHLGERDLGGYTLRILATAPDQAFSSAQYAPDELNSDPVNDAVLERNNILSDTYKCEIAVEFVEAHTGVEDRVKNDSLSGTVNYDIVSTGLSSLAVLAANGNLRDFYSIGDSNLQLDQPWWDQQAVEQLSITDKLYFVCGDILYTDDERTHMLFFNKDLIAENQLDDPYQLVKDGTWTLDRMYEMARAVAVDNGDGEMNVTTGDTWGFIGAAFDTYKFILGCDAPMVEKNEDDVPVISVLNTKNVDAFMKTYEMMTDRSACAYLEMFYRWDDSTGRETFYDQFYSGNALFMADNICALNSAKLQDSSVNYGVLPLPKYDESQDGYACTIDPYWFTCMALPAMAADTDLDKVTFLMEAMAYYNRSEVTPLYYDTTLKSKRLMDESSEEMLDIIFSNRIMDLANIFSWDDCIQYYNSMIFSGSNAIASYMESHQPAMQKGIDDTIEAFRKLGA